MKLQFLPQDFTVCKLKSPEEIDLTQEFCFVGKTDGEISLVCETRFVPKETLAREDGWRAFRIIGVLDFSLIGILAKISAVLAENNIGIFAVSTYNTDYVLLKRENVEKAADALKHAGYTVY